MDLGMELRVGQGFDIHPFTDDPLRPLILAGVRFEGAPGLRGHSDADAVAHALTDALLGAAGLGDIGSHFPDTDDRWKGADSMVLLAEAQRLVTAEGWRVANADITVRASRSRALAVRKAAAAVSRAQR